MLAQIDDIDVSFVINNAGVMYHDYFINLKMEEVTDMIQTNIIGVVYLTKLFIHRFDKRNCRSAIINVASIAGLVPIPFIQVYSATKMFLRSFTLAVGQEVSDKIDVLTHSPGLVETKMVKFKSGPDSVTPYECAQSIFRDIGLERENNPAIKHEVTAAMVGVMNYFSESLIAKLGISHGEQEQKRRDEYDNKSK